MDIYGLAIVSAIGVACGYFTYRLLAPKNGKNDPVSTGQMWFSFISAIVVVVSVSDAIYSMDIFPVLFGVFNVAVFGGAAFLLGYSYRRFVNPLPDDARLAFEYVAEWLLMRKIDPRTVSFTPYKGKPLARESEGIVLVGIGSETGYDMSAANQIGFAVEVVLNKRIVDGEIFRPYDVATEHVNASIRSRQYGITMVDALREMAMEYYADSSRRAEYSSSGKEDEGVANSVSRKQRKYRTHYDNLQVQERASQEVIVGAYRQLVKKWHPDRNKDRIEQAEKAMRIINAAYEVLSDPIKRKAHDEWIARNRQCVNDVSGCGEGTTFTAPGNGMGERSRSFADNINESSVKSIDLRKVGLAQRLLIWAVVASILGVIPIMTLVVLPFLWFSVWRLGVALQMRISTRIIYVLLMVIPLINIVMLLILNKKATTALSESGISVGLMGARLEDLPGPRNA
jgi:hypothetical protein